MSQETGDGVSAVASGILQSDLEQRLASKVKVGLNSSGADGDKPLKMTKKVSVKKVRLTPSKVLSMVVGGDKKAKSKTVLAASGSDEQDGAESGESGAFVKPGRKKQAKKDVKEALFGPGDFKRKIKKRGSSSEDEQAKQDKKPKRRKKKAKSVPKPVENEKEKTPPPKEKTPEPPPPVPEPAKKDPTPPPPQDLNKSPTPEPSPPPPPPKDEEGPEKQKEEAMSEKQKEESVEQNNKDPPETKAKSEAPPSTPPPAPPPPLDPAEPNGPPTDTDEEVLPETGYFSPATQANYEDLICPKKCNRKAEYSLQRRLWWLLVLIYRGPVRIAAHHIFRTTAYPQLILGPTFESLLFEYLLLVLTAADQFITDWFPDLHIERVGDLMKELDTDSD